jgi:hypothetical protein
MDKLNALRGYLQDVLQGEPLRAIVYGSAVVVWLVTHIATAAGYQGFGQVNLDGALAAATTASVVVTEIARRYVYSPSSAAALALGAMADSGVAVDTSADTTDFTPAPAGAPPEAAAEADSVAVDVPTPPDEAPPVDVPAEAPVVASNVIP